MSLLPERKKSPEEIARLRESLGIPGASAGAPAEEIPAEAPAVPAAPILTPELSPPAVIEPAADVPEPLVPESPTLPAPAPKSTHRHSGPKPVLSLKRSERIPTLPAEEPAPLEVPPAPDPHGPKPVRSLRKSEQVPLPAEPHEPSPDSPLPFHRHSDQELNEIRRREALAMMTPVVNPKLAAAHPALILPGYLLALAAAIGIYFYEIPIYLSAACLLVCAIIAAIIFLKKPISRHHAAFIAVITLFVIVFGALHYFPHLRHAT